MEKTKIKYQEAFEEEHKGINLRINRNISLFGTEVIKETNETRVFKKVIWKKETKYFKVDFQQLLFIYLFIKILSQILQ